MIAYPKEYFCKTGSNIVKMYDTEIYLSIQCVHFKNHYKYNKSK